MLVGSLLVAGGWSAALAQEGELDPTFGNNTGGVVVGRTVIPQIPAMAVPRKMVMQPDDKLVVLGTAVLARFNANGSADLTFGTGGLTSVTSFNGYALALQPDGMIIVAGEGLSYEDFKVARFLPDGQVDASFGVNGIVTIDFHSIVEGAAAVSVGGDGKISVVGTTFDALSPAVWVAVARLHTDGSFDNTFGGTGRVVTNVESVSVYDAVHQPDGKLVVTGRHVPSDIGRILRFLDDGSLDPSFGSNGIVIDTTLSYTRAVAIHPAGGILVTGNRPSNFPRRLCAIRYRADGSPDASFGVNGLAESPESGSGVDVIVQPDGKIVVAGISNSNGIQIGVLRFDMDGSLDAPFGTSGLTVYGAVGADILPAAVGLQTDGRLVVAGWFQRILPTPHSDWLLLGLTGTPPRRITSFLTSNEGGPLPGPGQASSYSMGSHAPPAQTLSVAPPDGAIWTDETPRTGSFMPGATLRLHLACAPNVPSEMQIRVHALSADRTSSQMLGGVRHQVGCQKGTTIVDIPITARLPLWLSNQKLQVSIRNAAAVTFDLPLGAATFFKASRFFSTP